MSLPSKLTYEPNELGFGTSGLRGLLSDMTDLECYINTSGFIKFLLNNKEDIDTIHLAGDLRSSTPHIMQVIAKAITDAGISYLNCGLIPTPAVALFSLTHNQPCIMVTGSHIPDDRNGIKFYKSAGEVLKDDEVAIREAVAEVRSYIYKHGEEQFNADGSLAEDAPDLSKEDLDAYDMFVARHLDFFDHDSFIGDSIVMYQHSAVGRDMIPEILEGLGAKVILADRSEKFIPIDTENVRPQDAEHFRKLATNNKGCFAIISTDGDSDRPFVIDETGVFHRGDILGLVVSKFLGCEAVAFPISSNDALTTDLDKRGVRFEYTKIGSPHVISKMDELKDEFKNVSGWEVNGGFLVGEDFEMNGKTLSALPTRDALLPIICALLAAKQNNQKVSELFAALPRRFTQAGLIDNFPSEVSAKIVETLGRNDEAARQLLSSVFRSDQGFGKITDINTIDGPRITFDNNEVAHLRPSGNAPQLRIYTNADTQERADEIVALAVAEPDGILRQIEKLISQ